MSPQRHPAGRLLARSLAIAALLAAAAGAPASALAAGLGLVPHHAVYALTRRHTVVPSDVLAVKGRMEVTLEGSCDGWRLEQDLGFRMLGSDETELEHLGQLSAFESADGHDFWFHARTWEDRKLVEELSGVAHSGENGAEVRYARPDPGTESLPRGTVFPLGHLRDILAAAHAGKRYLDRTVFDGSTQDNPFDVTAFITRAPHPGAAQRAPALARVHAWNVRLAYYAVDAVQPDPDFEMSAEVFDNGVVGDMVYDYGDLQVDVTLKELHLGHAPVCKAPGRRRLPRAPGATR